MRVHIFSLYEQRYAAHLGCVRTLAVIKYRFYWQNMSDDVARWCNECQKCARFKPGPGKGDLKSRKLEHTDICLLWL